MGAEALEALARIAQNGLRGNKAAAGRQIPAKALRLNACGKTQPLQLAALGTGVMVAAINQVAAIDLAGSLGAIRTREHHEGVGAVAAESDSGFIYRFFPGAGSVSPVHFAGPASIEVCKNVLIILKVKLRA